MYVFLTAFSPSKAQESDFFTWVEKNHITQELLTPRFQKKVFALHADENVIRKMLQEAVKQNNPQKIATAANAVGLNSLMNAHPDQALKYFKQAIDAAKKSNDAKTEISALAESGLAYRLTHQPEKALETYQEAYQGSVRFKWHDAEYYLLSQLAEVYLSLNNTDAAAEYFSRAAKAYQSHKKTTLAAISLNALGELQLRNNDYNKALEAFTAALSIIENAKEHTLKGILHRNMGLVYFKKGKFELALAAFHKSITFDNQLLVHQLTKDTYMQLFTLYSYQNNFEKADAFHEKYIDAKESLAKNTNTKLSAAETLWQNREKDIVIALLRKSNQNSTTNEESNKLELSQLITKTEVELNQKDEALEVKTAEVEQLTKEKAVQQRDMARQELQISKQKNFRNILLILSLGAIVFLAFLYNRYLFKKKSNLKLQASNQELENTLKQLRETQDQLLQSEKMASLGLLTAGIAHEIQNPLNFVVNFSEGSLEVVEELLNAKSTEEKVALAEELQGSLQKIHHHGKRAERIVKSMLQHSREGSGEKENVELNQLLHESINLGYHGARVNHKEFQCIIKEDLDNTIPSMKVIPQDVSRVFLNIANNAFYALREKAQREPDFKSELKISSTLKGNMVELRIKDNGIGIPKEKIDKIFQPFFTTKPSGQGTGLGLSMSYDIITKSHQGKIEIQSKENEFTEFIIQLPLTVI